MKGHDHNGKELWVTAKYNDKPKMDERKKDKQATAFRIEGQVLQDMKAIALENERYFSKFLIRCYNSFLIPSFAQHHKSYLPPSVLLRYFLQ